MERRKSVFTLLSLEVGNFYLNNFKAINRFACNSKMFGNFKSRKLFIFKFYFKNGDNDYFKALITLHIQEKSMNLSL